MPKRSFLDPTDAAGPLRFARPILFIASWAPHTPHRHPRGLRGWFRPPVNGAVSLPPADPIHSPGLVLNGVGGQVLGLDRSRHLTPPDLRLRVHRSALNRHGQSAQDERSTSGT
jgi:hypothetical protein